MSTASRVRNRSPGTSTESSSTSPNKSDSRRAVLAFSLTDDVGRLSMRYDAP